MIRNLLATTAIATLVATGAYAQSTAPTTSDPGATSSEPAAPMVKHAKGHLASELIGKRVYNGTGDDAKNIGAVSDLVMDEQGAVQAIVVGVGGFLGIGQKEVALEYDLVQWGERDGEEWLIVETTADALKAQQEFDRAAYEPMPADADVAETKPATAEDLANAPKLDEGQAADDSASAPADDQSTTGVAPVPVPTGDGAAPADDTASAPADSAPAADDTAAATDDAASDTTAAAPADDTETDTTAAAPGDDTQTSGESASSADTQTTDDSMAAAPADDAATETDQTETGAIDRSSLQEMPVDDIRSEDLVGTTVYGANEEDVGEIGDVILSEDGKVDAILVDVGGFLGMGEKEVAVGMDNLSFMSDADGNMYLYTGLTKEQLDQQAAYDESTYADNRDEMRMTAPEAAE